MRDETLKKTRPEIASIESGKSSNDAEVFQNETLRPILKFQHDLMVAIFDDYIKKRKGVFHALSPHKKKEYIKNSLTKDSKFRNLMMGLVLGHFTSAEWTHFSENHSELTKRTMNMMTARLESVFLQ